MSPIATWQEDDLELALDHLAQDRFDEAAKLLRKCIQRRPGRLAAVRGLASAYLGLENHSAARKVLADYTSAFPMCQHGWRLAALLEWKLGLRDAAVAMLDRGLSRLPGSSLLHRQMNLFRGAMGQAPMIDGPDALHIGETQSTPDWLDRLAQDPRLLEGILNNTAHDQPDTEMLKVIEQRLSSLLEAQPAHADRQVLLARLRMRLGDSAGAMLAVHYALRANSSYIQAHRLRAEIAAQMGDDEQAIQTLESLVARGISWPDLHCQIAELQQRKGQLDRARSHLWQAIQAAPDYKKAHELLAKCAA